MSKEAEPLTDEELEEVREIVEAAEPSELIAACYARLLSITLAARDARIGELETLGGIECPVSDGQPDPCPSCGASVADGVCQAGNPEAARLQLLLKERDAEIERLSTSLEEQEAVWSGEVGSLHEEIRQLRAKVAELLELAEHQPPCPLWDDPVGKCSCGLEDLQQDKLVQECVREQDND